MAQRQREAIRHGEPPEEKDEVTLTFKNADGTKTELSVKKGTGVSDFLKSLKHSFRQGLNYKLNNVLLSVDKETGELLENSLILEDAVLVIEQTFTGGK